MRLFCFPWAGAGSTAYFPWRRELADDIEVCAVQLPGRENRLRERPLTDLARITALLADAIEPWIDGEFAFFGHSFGSLVAFELVRELRRRGLRLPTVLFASGREAPACLHDGDPISHLEESAFLHGVIRRYNAIPEQLLAEREMLDILLPALRADLSITEGYAYTEEPRLPVRVRAFGGTDDPRVTLPGLRRWEEQSADFELKLFTGGHFFVNDSRARVISAVRAELLGGVAAP